MILDFDMQKAYQQSIDIVDAGNTAIRCTTANGEDYYIIVKTILGKTNILKCGPILADVPVLLDGYSLSYKKINYKEASIAKEINLFVNDPKKGINEVVELTEYEVFEALPDIKVLFNEV